MVGSSTGWTGILEYWMEYLRSVCLFWVLFVRICSYIYIPRPFYTYFLLDGTCEANGGRCI